MTWSRRVASRLAVLLAVLFALPASAAVAVLPVRSGPLATLGGVLNSALPGLTAIDSAASLPLTAPALAVPGLPVPASLDARKAAVLLKRAAALPVPVSATAFEPAPVEPKRLLETVNSLLKDFSPEDLRSLPVEDLHALSGAILDGASGAKTNGDIAVVSVLARAGVVRARALSLRPLEEKLHNPGHNESHGDIITVTGVPATVKEVPAEGRVLRHYTTAEGLEAILREKSLWNGFLPYVQLARGVFRKTFKDLTGVFLTERAQDGAGVGVPSSEFPYWVDLLLPPGLALLEVEPGAIYLVPLPVRTRGWAADIYRRWAAGGKVKPHEESMIESLDREGGPGPELKVPIVIVAHGRAS